MKQARPTAALKRMRLPEQFAWMPFVLPGVTVAVLLTVYPTYSVVSASLFGETAKGNGFVGLEISPHSFASRGWNSTCGTLFFGSS